MSSLQYPQVPILKMESEKLYLSSCSLAQICCLHLVKVFLACIVPGIKQLMMQLGSIWPYSVRDINNIKPSRNLLLEQSHGYHCLPYSRIAFDAESRRYWSQHSWVWGIHIPRNSCLSVWPPRQKYFFKLVMPRSTDCLTLLCQKHLHIQSCWVPADYLKIRASLFHAREVHTYGCSQENCLGSIAIFLAAARPGVIGRGICFLVENKKRGSAQAH